jgi:hypothetical protein
MGVEECTWMSWRWKKPVRTEWSVQDGIIGSMWVATKWELRRIHFTVSDAAMLWLSGVELLILPSRAMSW